MSPKIMAVCAALLLAIPAVMARQDGGAAPSGEAPQTRDRLSPERMDALVSGPMSLVRSGRLADGKAAFARRLAATRERRGERSVEVADLLTAFGVGLYTAGLDNADRHLKAEAIPYLEAAIPVYRVAFGDTHPEVAVALTSYADAQAASDEANPPQGVDAAREEAYRISLGAFGPTHRETLATLRYLARLRGLPSQTRSNPTRIEAAAALFRQLVAQSPNRAQPEYLSAPAGRTAFARMYAQHRMATEAREQLRLAIEGTAGWDPVDKCVFRSVETARLEAILAGGDMQLHDPILPALAAPEHCFMLEAVPEDLQSASATAARTAR